MSTWFDFGICDNCGGTNTRHEQQEDGGYLRRCLGCNARQEPERPPAEPDITPEVLAACPELTGPCGHCGGSRHLHVRGVDNLVRKQCTECWHIGRPYNVAFQLKQAEEAATAAKETPVDVIPDYAKFPANPPCRFCGRPNLYAATDAPKELVVWCPECGGLGVFSIATDARPTWNEQWTAPMKPIRDALKKIGDEADAGKPDWAAKFGDLNDPATIAAIERAVAGIKAARLAKLADETPKEGDIFSRAEIDQARRDIVAEMAMKKAPAVPRAEQEGRDTPPCH